jgi:hypothetical protein
MRALVIIVLGSSILIGASVIRGVTYSLTHVVTLFTAPSANQDNTRHEKPPEDHVRS